MEAAVNWIGLPDEILEIIFSYCTHSDLVQSIQNACYRWREVAQSTRVWKDVTYCAEYNTRSKQVVEMLKISPKLQNIILHSNYDGRVLHAITDNCAELRKLEVIPYPYTMRKHKMKPGARRYNSGIEEDMQKAIDDVKSGKLSMTKAAKVYNISKGTLFNRIHDKHSNKCGRPAVFSVVEEEAFVQYVLEVSEWGFPFDLQDLRYLGKLYLEKVGRKVPAFGPTNLPGVEWATSFMQRHKNVLARRTCQNLKLSKAEVTAEHVQEYFGHLKGSLKERDSDTLIPPERIFNYDETNLSDDPGVRKCLFKRGKKYPERIKDSSKTSVSVMFCGSAAGFLLPPYVVYKAEHMWENWMQGGPKNTRYNRSRSGWFDSSIFLDWFQSIFIPHTRHLLAQGKVALIGDNLSSHFSPDVLKLATENNICFICIPRNATHICQPLDVAFYGPVKKYWRGILDRWKSGQRKRSQAVTKEAFPGLLKELFEKVCDTKNSNLSLNLNAGFRKCGIVPFEPNEVICRLPDSTAHRMEAVSPVVSDCIKEMLKEMRHGEKGNSKFRRKRVNVPAGIGITIEDYEPPQLDDLAETPKISRKRKRRNPSTSSNESSEASLHVSYMDTSDNGIEDNEDGNSQPGAEKGTEMEEMEETEAELKIGCFAIVRVPTIKENVFRHYVAEILNIDSEQKCCVRYLRKVNRKFVWPDVEDKDTVDQTQIVLILSKPDILKRGFLFKRNEVDGFNLC